MKHKRLVLSALDPTQEERYRGALDVVSRMRRNRRFSLEMVSGNVGIDPRTVRRYAGSAFEKKRGRWHVKSFDRLPRTLRFFSVEVGYTELTTRSSKTASMVSRYQRALNAYAQYGDDSLLREFDGTSITVQNHRYHFLTDRRRLSHLIRAGDLHVEDIYGSGGLQS